MNLHKKEERRLGKEGSLKYNGIMNDGNTESRLAEIRKTLESIQNHTPAISYLLNTKESQQSNLTEEEDIGTGGKNDQGKDVVDSSLNKKVNKNSNLIDTSILNVVELEDSEEDAENVTASEVRTRKLQALDFVSALETLKSIHSNEAGLKSPTRPTATTSTSPRNLSQQPLSRTPSSPLLKNGRHFTPNPSSKRINSRNRFSPNEKRKIRGVDTMKLERSDEAEEGQEDRLSSFEEGNKRNTFPQNARKLYSQTLINLLQSQQK